MSNPYDQFDAAPAPAPAAAAPANPYDQFDAPAQPAAPPQSSPAADKFLAGTAVGRVLDAFGQGAKDGWGAGSYSGFSPETDKQLRDLGVFNDVATYNQNVGKAFNEAILRPLAYASRGLTALTGGLYGAANAISPKAGEAVEAATDPGLQQTLMAAGPAGDAAALALKGVRAVLGVDRLKAARDLGVIGEPPPVLTREVPPPENPIVAAARADTNGTIERINESVSMPQTTGETIPLVEGPRTFAASSPNPDMVRETPTSILDKAGNIRLDNADWSSGAKDVIRQIADEQGGSDAFMSARRGVISDAQRGALADASGISGDELLSSRKIGGAFNDTEIELATRAFKQAAYDAQDAGRKLAVDDSDMNVQAYAEARAKVQALQEQFSGVTAEGGRALRALGAAKQATAETQPLTDFLKDATGKSREDLIEEAKALPPLNDPSSINGFLNDARKPDFGDKFLYYWKNNLLSGPFTHTAYVISNALHAFTQAGLVTPVAGAIGALRRAAPEDRVFAGEAVPQLWGLIRGLPAALKTGAASVYNNTPVQLPGAKAVKPFVPPIGGMVGKGVGLPQRVIQGIHATFSDLGYHMGINEQAYRTAAGEGLKGDDFGARVAQLTANPTDDMMEAARSKADYQTFASELGDKGQAIQRAVKTLGPVAEAVVPFVRTPGNLIKIAYEHSPLAWRDRDMRADLTGANGGAARDTALAKVVVGSTAAGVVAYQATQDNITGGGPSDPKAYAEWALTHKPYSIRVGGVWYDYRRVMGPYGIATGMAADLAGAVGKLPDGEYAEAANRVAHGFAHAIVDESWSKGLSDALNALEDKEGEGARFIKQQVSNLMPYSVGMSQMASMLDPYTRETKGWLDEVLAKIPYERNKLLPKLDTFGQPVPNDRTGFGAIVAARRVQTDPVYTEMARLGMAPGQVERRIGTVPLTDEQHEEYQMTAGRMAKAPLDQWVNSPWWHSMPDFAQREMIQNTITAGHKSAETYMKMAHPEIIQQDMDTRAKAIAGTAK